MPDSTSIRNEPISIPDNFEEELWKYSRSGLLPTAAELFYSNVNIRNICGEEDERIISDDPRICHLEILFANSSGHATGFFLGPRCVITAGHCVCGKEGWAKAIRVVPGRNGSSEPYGSQFSNDFRAVSEWAGSGPGSRRSEFDFGAIILPDNALSTAVGYFENINGLRGGLYELAHSA